MHYINITVHLKRQQNHYGLTYSFFNNQLRKLYVHRQCNRGGNTRYGLCAICTLTLWWRDRHEQMTSVNLFVCAFAFVIYVFTYLLDVQGQPWVGWGGDVLSSDVCHDVFVFPKGQAGCG